MRKVIISINKGIPHRSLFRISEAAELLGLSRWTLYRLINEGKLEALKVGRIIRVTRGALLAFMTVRPV
jgi:excisionase family DNA binding protein